MPAANQLRSIKSFKDLIAFLQDDLDWPLDEYDFDDLTFEYAPAELGLRDEQAAKVKTIHQLRPLNGNQPWGIFFIEFENKKLPVTVLRRILSHLVVKKRASANRAERAAWQADDLMFISAYGDERTDQREIAFAHFHQADGDLPTLRVLGWDGADTPLKLEHVAGQLKQKLSWPDDLADADAWREQWRSPFRHRIGHVIRTADNLAEVLATLAKRIRSAAHTLLEAENERGALTRLYESFRAALIHDLTPETFADTYAQTITYGLLTAAISRTEMSDGRHGTVLLVENVTDMVPVTNPFLKEMLQEFLRVGGRKGAIDFDELGIQDVVDLLRGEETDLPAILRDFGNRTRGEDPVIHFYEHFLTAYNKRLKVQRGVFYTPQPVVSYIVRSVHELLQTEFGLEDGLASTVTWGEMIARSAAVSAGPAAATPNEKGASNKTKPLAVVEAAAAGLRHSRAPLKLPTVNEPGEPEKTISPDEPFVIGNPPYSNFGQLNKIPFILNLLEDYKRGLDEKKLNLDDDFIKFVRLSQSLLEKSMVGVLGMITNNVYFDGITHRRMRESLLESFQSLHLLNLHGSSVIPEAGRNGVRDENVFDIQQGVGVSIFVKPHLSRISRVVFHSDLWGTRETKYQTLCRLKLNDGSWAEVSPHNPYQFFVPKDFGVQDEYKSGWSTKDIFQVAGQGIETKRDSLTIGFSPEQIREALEDVRRGSKSAVTSKYELPDDGRDWTFEWAREDVAKNKGQVSKIAYRPFDCRFTYFTGKTKGFIAYPRTSVSRFLLEGSNPALIVNRFVKLDYYAHAFVTKGLVERHLLETANVCLVVYPLFANETSEDGGLNFGSSGRELNYSPAFMSALSSKLKLSQKGAHGLPVGVTPEDIFHYAYAVFHSPGYRSRYAEFLKIDFPRLPLTVNLELFRALARLGGELTALHLLEFPQKETKETKTSFPSLPSVPEFFGRNPQVEKISWSGGTVWLDKARTTGFKGVREDVWNFHIGGYQVCEKWLKDRGPKKGKPGRTLTQDDITHYQKIVVALSETIRSMKEIDKVIEEHGGWPLK